MRIQITLQDAVFGVDRDVDVMHNEPCSACDGTGSATKKTNTCPPDVAEAGRNVAPTILRSASLSVWQPVPSAEGRAGFLKNAAKHAMAAVTRG